MDYGLEVYNDENILQINSTYKNHFLMDKGKVTLTEFNGDYSGQLPEGVRYTGRNPFIAIKNSRPVRVVRERSGNNFHFRFIWNGARSPSDIWTLDYYLYDSLPPTVSEHGIGLQVFADDNSPIFDSNLPFCSVVGVIQQTAIFHPINTTTRTYTYDFDNIAIALCQQAYYLLEVPFEGPGGIIVSGTEYYSITAFVSGRVVTTYDGLERSNQGGPGTQARQNNAMFLVVDVKGL